MSDRPPPPLLRLTGITKRFGSLVANDDISLALGRGEVLALLGENGAGKSTLVSILFGHYRADAGTVEIDGVPLPPGEPGAALAAGIGMVHQHFTLADNLTVLDNVMLGTEPLWQPFSRRREARDALLATARRFGLQVDPSARISQLSVGERQRVEILKALLSFGRKQGARLLILDEPTAVLTPQESESLFATLGEMVKAGLSLIFISHKLDEVLRVSDQIAVLRAGRLVDLRPAAGADKASLAEAMVGRRVAAAQKRPGDGRATAAPVVVELREAGVAGAHGRPGLVDVNLQIRAGEVLAIAGVAGNGQQLLAELLSGEQALDSGTLRVAGQALPARPRAWVQAGVARIPEDRHAVGVVGDLPVWANAVLEHVGSPPVSRGGWLCRAVARAHAARLVQGYDVRGTESGGLETPTRGLSGGNMQKLILGRALSGRPLEPGAAAPAGNDTADKAKRPPPPFILANQPTWGLDVGAVAYVHQQLMDACAAGSAVLLISEDLDEIFALADHIAVMHHGRLGQSRPRADWSLASIGLAMGGAAEAAAPASAPEVDHAA